MTQLALAPDLARQPLRVFIVVYYDCSERTDHVEVFYHRDRAIEHVESLGANRLPDVNRTAIFCSDVGTIEIIESTVE